MKKILMLTAIVIGMVCNINAQENSWGIRGGMNIQQLNEKDGEGEDDYKSKVGFNLGIIYDWGVSENFYIQPGLYFTTRGTNIDEANNDVKYNLNYLQIPILASYRLDLGGDIKLHINAGPYLAFGVGGKIKVEAGDFDIDPFDDDEGDLKRFDAGLSFGTGVSFGKIYAGLSYDLGLTNISNEDGYKLQNRNFSISVGYNF